MKNIPILSSQVECPPILLVTDCCLEGKPPQLFCAICNKPRWLVFNGVVSAVVNCVTTVRDFDVSIGLTSMEGVQGGVGLDREFSFRIFL